MSLLPRRLNARIVLVVSCILLATGVASGWMTARDQTASLLAAMRQNSSIMVRNFAESCARDLLVQDYAELEAFLLKSAELPHVRRLQICEPNGTLIWDVERSAGESPRAKTGIARIDPPASRVATMAVDNDLLVIWQPIEAGNLLGWLKADFSLSAIREAQARTWENTLILAMAWVAGSALLIILVLRPIVQSIGRLTAFSKRLDEHKGEQISVGDQPLEIAELGASLNEASAKLRSTERQLLDERERLRQSERDLNEAQRVSHTGSWDWDAATDTTTWSQEYYRIYGFDPAERPPGYEEHLKAYTPESAAQLNAAVKRQMETGEPYELDLELVRSEGRQRWIRARSETKRGADGQTVGLRGTAQDITERKRVEEELRRSEEKYRTIFEESFDGLFLTSPAGNIIDMNKKGVQMFGYDRKEDVMKLDLARDVYAYPPDRTRILAMVEAQGTAEYEVVVKKKSGDTMVTHCALTAVKDDTGAITTYRGIIRDITASKKAEEEIRKLNQELEQRVADRTAQLEEANKELEAFAYSVSHDLRAPLRHIDGFLSLLEEKTAATLDDEGRHYMDTIAKSAKNMSTLIDDLLSFSRMGRSGMAKTDVDLDALVQEIIRDFEPEMDGRVICWSVADLPVVTGDRAMLRVAMMNLISNALKFTQQRQQTEIDIGCLPGDDKETVVFVRDNGAGFDMQYAGKLFGVFQRLHGTTEFEGTGIGLANVRRVIGRHGGRTWAEGKVDGGATFYFSLPQSAPQDSRP